MTARLASLLLLAAVSPGACPATAAAPMVPVIPLPHEVAATGGTVALAGRVAVVSLPAPAADDRRELARLAVLAAEFLRQAGVDAIVAADGGGLRPGSGSVRVELGLGGDAGRLGEEGYDLAVGDDGIAIAAARPAGVFYGLQTLRQLLPSCRQAGAVALPRLRVVDRPRYAWRGFMLDCCRHYVPTSFLRTCLETMALHKLNRFHWHLTDDQAWRLAIARYPELTARGAWRDEGGRRVGGFYSPDEVREIVAYAAERFITVVPEIEMPGHATAALTTYPELSCTGGPFARMAQWGVFEDVYCAGNEQTFTFIENVLDEVAALFPGRWVHVGGDECPKSRWRACPRCQARMRDEGLASAEELQSWFVRRVERHLAARGRRLIGWDEILEGGLAPNAAVMSWRGLAGGIAAARQGHDVVMAPTSAVYLDYYQGDPRFEPPGIGGSLPLETVYAFEPTPPDLTAAEATHVLGAQANLWTEYVSTPEHASHMMWPRLSALAEVTWSEAADRDWASFLARLPAMRARLAAAGVRIADTVWRPAVAVRAVPERRAWRVEMGAALPQATVRLTVDGRDPRASSRPYRAPFELTRGGVVRAALFAGHERLGPVAEVRAWRHRAAFAPVRVTVAGRVRPEGGEARLTDGLAASLHHDDGGWLGVEGGDLEATIDLGRPREVRRVATRFLERPAAWIFPPTEVAVSVSADGRSWSAAGTTGLAASDDFTVIRGRDVDLRFAAQPARFVRLTARSIGVCPPGHNGAGGKAWLYLDEIAVE